MNIMMPCYKILCLHTQHPYSVILSSTLPSALSSEWVHSKVTRLSPAATRASFVIMLIEHCITTGHSVLNVAFLGRLHDGGGPRTGKYICFLYLRNMSADVHAYLGHPWVKPFGPGKHLEVFGYEQGHTPITKLITVSRHRD